MAENTFHIDQINNEFNKRKRKNSSYSLRSFARDLGIDSSSLSSIISRKRKIPLKQITMIAEKVCTNEKEKARFISCAKLRHLSLARMDLVSPLPKRHKISDKDFAIVSDFNAYTILSVLELDDFRYDENWIVDKTKIPLPIVREKIKSLKSVGLCKEVNGTLVKTKKRTTTNDGVASKVIQKHHTDALEVAKLKCRELGPDKRYFSTITIPTDIESLGEVTKLIMEFEDKIEAFLLTKKKKDVTKLSIQFYPVSENRI